MVALGQHDDHRGNADGAKPEHAVKMFKLRGGGDEDVASTGAIWARDNRGSGRVKAARLGTGGRLAPPNAGAATP